MSKILNIAVGSVHAGYELKSVVVDYLNMKGYKVADCGCFSLESVDYPDYAQAVVKEILSERSQVGILICGTGIGVSIAANRYDGIRAAVCSSEELAEMTRKHNDANVLSIGARVFGDDIELIKSIIDKFLSTEFDGGRHEIRRDKLDIHS